MKVIQKLFLILIVMPAALSAATGIRIVKDSVRDRVLTAAGEESNTRISTREMLVDLEFSSNRTAKGVLLVLFEPSSGHFFWELWWEKGDYPNRSLMDDFGTESWVGVLPDRLVIFSFGNPVLFVHETTEKAGSMDDAESRILKYAADHPSEIEGWAKRYRTISVHLSELGVAPGFFPRVGQPSSQSSLPVKGLLGLARHNGFWELTVEGQYKAKWLLDDQYGTRGVVRIEQSEEKVKH